MLDNTLMYKSPYKPIDGYPLTETIPALLEWKGVSPYRIEAETNGELKQASIHRICAGLTKNPKRPMIERLAEYFGVTFNQLYDVDLIQAMVTGDLDSLHEIDQFLAIMRERLLRAEALDRKKLMEALLLLSK